MSDCPNCDALQARVDQAEALVAQMLAQNGIAAQNTAVARRALEEFLEPTPVPSRRLAS